MPSARETAVAQCLIARGAQLGAGQQSTQPGTSLLLPMCASLLDAPLPADVQLCAPLCAGSPVFDALLPACGSELNGTLEQPPAPLPLLRALPLPSNMPPQPQSLPLPLGGPQLLRAPSLPKLLPCSSVLKRLASPPTEAWCDVAPDAYALPPLPWVSAALATPVAPMPCVQPCAPPLGSRSRRRGVRGGRRGHRSRTLMSYC